MPQQDRPRPLAAPRGRASRREAPTGQWVVDVGWVVHRCSEVTRMVPLAVAEAALDRVAADGAVRPDGSLDESRVRGLRSHHAVHGRFHVELRGSRWELVWCPRGAAAQRLSLAGVAEHVGVRRWSRERAA
jgi:hypothetical protein